MLFLSLNSFAASIIECQPQGVPALAINPYASAKIFLEEDSKYLKSISGSVSWPSGSGPSYDSLGALRILHSSGFTEKKLDITNLELIVDGDVGRVYKFKETSLGDRRHIVYFNKQLSEWMIYILHRQGYSFFICQ